MVRKINFLSISMLFSAIATFMSKKKSSLWISPKIIQNNRKAQFSSMWLTFWRKSIFLIIIPFYWFNKKNWFKQIQIFPEFALFKHVKKNKLSEFFSACFWGSHFKSKKKLFLWILHKCFKTTERHSLAVCGSLCGEKYFLLIYIPFYWFY